MKNFSFENQGTNTYLVYTVNSEDTIDTMSLGMLTNNKILGLAPTMFTQMDTTKYIKYNVTSHISVRQFFSGVVNKKRLIGVFKGIVNAMLSAEEYMIDINSIIVDMDFMFTDVSTCETILVCLPVIGPEIQNVDLGVFFKNIVFTTQFDQTENCDYLARIINYLNSSSIFSLDDFKNVLEEIEQGNFSNAFTAHRAQPVVTPAPAANNNAVPVQNKQPVNPVVNEVKKAPANPVVNEQVKIPGNNANNNFQSYAAPNAMGNNMAIPGGAPVNPDNNVATEPSEKKMSMLYLLQHYNKENAAIYKAQKENKKAKGAAKASGAPIPGQPAPVNNGGFAVPGQPAPANNGGFAIPGQPAPANNGGFAIPGQPAPANNGGFAIPGQPAPAPQPKVQPVVNQQPKVQPQPVAQPAPAPQPAPQPVQNNPYKVPGAPAGTSMNFGETTVLGAGAGIGETTVLSEMPQVQAVKPRLIRGKNNETISLNKPVFRIGKEKSYVDYFIGDNSAISRSHANVISRDGQYFVTDTNSTNHTYVNGKMIQSNIEVPLADGDKIRLANEDFEFKLY